MQHKENYQQVLVSKTVFKKLVHAHAVCSDCGMPADIHGGYMPCRGAHIIIDMEIINAVAAKTSKPDAGPEPPITGLKHCRHGHTIGNNRTCTQCAIESHRDDFRLRE
jgi:hypothetical protein